MENYRFQQQEQQESQPQVQQQERQQGQQQQQSNELVHCFWALMTYGDLRFIYLSSSVQRAVSAKYKQLLGKSFFDYIHPDEAKLARKDLNAFMDVHNLYGSVTRCRFQNVCPEWEQRKHSRKSSSKGANKDMYSNDMDIMAQTLPENPGVNHLENNNESNTMSNGASTSHNGFLSEDRRKDYEDAFQNGEENDYMILDVVMNVVSDEVVLGFFHIDGQGLYKGFWSNGICGESKESLPTLAPEILRHLRDSMSVMNGVEKSTNANPSSPERRHRRQNNDNGTKRIFQIYDAQNRNLLLTWPEPGNLTETGALTYSPELYTQIVKSHHIPADALENTTCLKRFCSKHALPSLGPSNQEPAFQVESVFIPYGYIIFACFQTSPVVPPNTWTTTASPTSSTMTHQGSHTTATSPGLRTYGSGYEVTGSSDHPTSIRTIPSPGTANSAMLSSTSGSPPSALNSPLVIPSLPTLSPFLKHAVASSPSQTGPIRNSKNSTSNQSSSFHPYSRNTGLSTNSSASSSPSSLPLPESMQESLSFLNDYKVGDSDRGRDLSAEERLALGLREGSPHSMWHASTPHPAIAAMVGHALAPSSPSFQRTVNNPDSRLSQTRQKTSGLSAPAEVYGSSKDKDGKLRKLPPSPRHPALDAAIRKKSSSASSSSPPTSYQEADTAESGTRSGHGNSHVLRVQQEEKSCESCGTTNSPEWRRGQSGKKDLCNACGLRYSRSVARQNRQAQKQLEGKGPKAKVVKSGKAAKSSPKKGVSAEPSSIGSVMDDTMLHPNTNFMQDSAQHSQQNQQIQHTQASQLTHAYPSEPGIGSIYSLAVKPSFYHGQ